MRVAALIKQTPQVASVQVSDRVNWPETDLIINPFDEYAVEEALRIKEKTGWKTVAISCGHESAESVLRDALALGIDEAVLIVDKEYAFLNPVRTAAILAGAVLRLDDVGLVLTGKQATDDDSSFVGSAVATYLGWPSACFVRQFESIASDQVICQRVTDEGYDRVEVRLPAIFSVVKEINEPRLPSLKGKMMAKKAVIAKWDASEVALARNADLQLVSIAPPPQRPAGEIFDGDPDETVAKLIDRLRQHQII